MQKCCHYGRIRSVSLTRSNGFFRLSRVTIRQPSADSFEPPFRPGIARSSISRHHRGIQTAGTVDCDAIKATAVPTSRTLLLRSCDPTGTNDLRSTVNADHCAKFSDTGRRWGEVGSDQIQELGYIRCHPMHYRHVFNRTGSNHALLKLLHCPRACTGLSSLLYHLNADVDRL